MLHGSGREDRGKEVLSLITSSIFTSLSYYILFYSIVILFWSQQNANWHTDVSIISFCNCYKRIRLILYESDFYAVILSICWWMNARMSNAGVRVTEFVRMLRSPAKWLWSLCWYFSYSAKYGWAVSTTCAGKHESVFAHGKDRSQGWSPRSRTS